MAYKLACNSVLSEWGRVNHQLQLNSMSAQRLATTEGKPPLRDIVQMRWSRMQMVSEMISANVGIPPRQNELLTKNTGFSVKRQVDFWSEFGTN